MRGVWCVGVRYEGVWCVGVRYEGGLVCEGLRSSFYEFHGVTELHVAVHG